MTRKTEDVKLRGVWEREPGSGEWWVRYLFHHRIAAHTHLAEARHVLNVQMHKVAEVRMFVR